MKTSGTVDVAIIGAGPSGCITALAFAQRGAEVALLEAMPEATKPLAGEWLHPPAVKIMERLGIPSIPAASEHPEGRGFVVFPHNNDRPIVLEYPAGSVGLSCEHNALVQTLRKKAMDHPGIDFMPFTKPIRTEGQRLTVKHQKNGKTTTIDANTIVGADGRFSTMRKKLGLSNKCTLLSYMAGVLLEDVEMPFEGFGHIFLGGPGPVLAYRLGPGHVRICLDVPIASFKLQDKKQYLWETYRPVLPPKLHAAFRKALDKNALSWAPNQFRPRIQYGRSGLALVGDSVGFFHPLTAIGMTLGFMDGECLARSGNFESYQRERHRHSHVPTLLAASLYELFTCDSEGAMLVCNAIYQMWRENLSECHRTMKILSGEETDLLVFTRQFSKGLNIATKQTLKQIHHLRRTTSLMGYFGKWLRWLTVSSLPSSLRPACPPRIASAPNGDIH